MPCMRCCRARCVFSPKLGIIIQDFARQLFDQLLADQAILMAGGAVLTLPPPIPVQRSHGFTRPTTRRGAECAPPTVKPLYLQTYFRLAASGSRGKAAAESWQRALQCAPRGGRSPRGDRHFLGLLDRPQPRRSSDAAGVPMSGPNNSCSNPIGKCVLRDPLGESGV